ncbi:Zn-ribbon domain-containing OB-fold protein [Candidatus Bathyarchaeota archaeon]|nr:Zn-ribbon domain-containing OB-fold protein [Candidatus Bathyarchaeota archaeon]
MTGEPSFTVKDFFTFLREGRLMGVRCLDCGEVTLPPRPVCKGCGSRNLEWTELKGRGIIEAFTVIHVAPSKFKSGAPYPLAVVKLEEGPRITARLTHCSPEGVSVGLPVEGDLEAWTKEGLLAFRPKVR